MQSEPSSRAATYTVAVRSLCAFVAKAGDLDLRFTPSPTAQQGREGHALVARRRGPGYEAEVSLAGDHKELHVRGRADGFDPQRCVLEEVKTFRGEVASIAPNHQALSWAQLKVYGALMCRARSLPRITLSLVYLDVVTQVEHPLYEECSASELEAFFGTLCEHFLVWARQELAHRNARDAALQNLEFPQKPFRSGQRGLAAGVYRACLQSHTLLVQAPTGIGKTIGTVFPALRAMPLRGTDKLFFLTAKTPGRQVALEALHKVVQSDRQFPLRVVELVAKDKTCEHKDKACHGQSCPLAQGFYDRLPVAREAAAQERWLDQAALRSVAREHRVCPYYLSHEMLRWADVVVGDYNYYFDRSAMLYALTVESAWRVSVLVDEAHNLYGRACAMYSAQLTHAQAVAVRPEVPAVLRPRVDELLNQWQVALAESARRDPAQPWALLPEVPEAWSRALQRFNSAVSEYLIDRPTEAHGALLPFYFSTLSFAGLAELFGEHSLCELDVAAQGVEALNFAPPQELQITLSDATFAVDASNAGSLTLRNIVPAPHLAARMLAADSMVLFSATLNPADYYIHLLGLPEATTLLDVPSPFKPEQLQVSVLPVSTHRAARAQTLDAMVDAMAARFQQHSGNYIAFFSSFEYLEMACARLQSRWPGIPAWPQARQMDEASRQAWLDQFQASGQGIGFAVLGGIFGEGIDLPGKRLIGAFIATLGLPQFDEVNQAIAQRMEARFGRGYDYTYLYPGLQKVVQAAGRVIRTESDEGSLLLMDRRYLEARYRGVLPAAWF